MATIPGTYEVSIPELNDAANIQDAFKLYHVGSTASNATPTSNSLAGYLSAIQTKLNDVSVNTANALSDAQDLNALITSGLYYRTTAPLANKNYPTITGFTSINPGYLTVTRSGNYVIQTYVTFTVPESNLGIPTVGIDNQNTAYFWRSATVSGSPASGDWNKWEQATTSSALKTVIDSIATKQALIPSTATVSPMLSVTALTASRVLTTDANGLAAASGVTTTELGVLSGGLASTGVGSLGAALTGKADLTLSNVTASSARNNLGIFQGTYPQARIFIQSTQPTTGMVAGDLWFW